MTLAPLVGESVFWWLLPVLCEIDEGGWRSNGTFLKIAATAALSRIHLCSLPHAPTGVNELRDHTSYVVAATPQLKERDGGDVLAICRDFQQPPGVEEHAVTVPVEQPGEGSAVTSEAALPQLDIRNLRSPHT